MTEQQVRDAMGGPTLHVPMAFGALVPTYNLLQLGGTRVHFSPQTPPNSFLGKIKKWNDPVMAADNPGAALPNEASSSSIARHRQALPRRVCRPQLRFRHPRRHRRA